MSESANPDFQFDNSYARLPERLFAACAPQPVKAPELLLFNRPLAQALGLDAALLAQQGVELFSGNRLAAGSEPLAQAYAGHQFGHPAMLGDGRAILLGEQMTPAQQRVDIQLKGAGRTPFSRGGDGRAALGPMLREYIISEAMHALAIPTTRSLAVVKTGEPVWRDTPLPGAILTRVAASHIRVGTFQYAAGQQNDELLRALFDYTLARHYPELAQAQNPALALLEAVMENQLELIVHWMRVGFIHGVMNTDNVTLSGETIDFGPCAFMDHYDPATVFSSIDHQGRYAYGNQPAITQWNLSRFAEALLTLMDEDVDAAVEKATALLQGFGERYEQKWLAMMRRKLGLFGEQPDDAQLVADLLDWMQQQQADFTNTFRDLISDILPDGELYQQAAFKAWHRRWQARLEQNGQPLEDALAMMRQQNPARIPRNHKVEQALQAAEQDDMAPLEALLEALVQPYADYPADDPYRQPPQPQEQVCQTFCGT